jgi:hypothetical protein
MYSPADARAAACRTGRRRSCRPVLTYSAEKSLALARRRNRDQSAVPGSRSSPRTSVFRAPWEKLSSHRLSCIFGSMTSGCHQKQLTACSATPRRNASLWALRVAGSHTASSQASGRDRCTAVAGTGIRGAQGCAVNCVLRSTAGGATEDSLALRTVATSPTAVDHDSCRRKLAALCAADVFTGQANSLHPIPRPATRGLCQPSPTPVESRRSSLEHAPPQQGVSW